MVRATLRRLPLLAALLALAAAALAAAGCGGGSSSNGSASGSGAVVRAADVTEKAGGAHLALSVQIAGQSIQGSGFVDTARKVARINLALPAGAGSLEERIIGRIVYIHLPAALAGRVPGGKPWLKLDLDKIAKAQGLNLGALQSTSSTNPTQTLELLRGSGSVMKVGTDTIRGVSTTHYKAVIDLNRVAQRAPPAQRAEAQASVQRLIQLLGHSTLPVDVWLDDQGRLRRETLSLPLPQGQVKTTIDLYDFGVSESVTAPPANQTYDASAALARRGAAAGTPSVP